MGDFLIQVIVGVIVTALATWFGLSGNKSNTTVISGVKVKKTGKKIIIVSILMIVGGLILIGSNTTPTGSIDKNNLKFWMGASLTGYGVIFYFIGKVVAWYQKL